MRERKAYAARAQFPTRGDKAVRAQSIRGRMELDGLYIPTQARWYSAFLSELLNFPAGKHDDQVDALGLIGQVLDRMNAGAAPKSEGPIRGVLRMTMDDLWALAVPVRGRAPLWCSALDDRRRLIGDEFPDAVLAHPDRQVPIVNVHDRAFHQNLGRHPAGHQRGAFDN